MSHKTAKALRRAMCVNLRSPRSYQRHSRGGPLVATGERGNYQRAKRSGIALALVHAKEL